MGCLGALACRSVRGGKYLKISGGGQHLAAFCIICLLNMWQTRGQDHLHDTTSECLLLMKAGLGLAGWGALVGAIKVLIRWAKFKQAWLNEKFAENPQKCTLMYCIVLSHGSDSQVYCLTELFVLES